MMTGLADALALQQQLARQLQQLVRAKDAKGREGARRTATTIDFLLFFASLRGPSRASREPTG
jgi:hypothetical protein